MNRLSLTLLVTLGLAASALGRQSVEIVQTTPVDGEAGVALEATILFRLSKPLPPFGSVFTKKFSWSPVTASKLWGLGHDWDENRSLTLVFFELEHAPNTDFSFWVYGVRTNDGSLMARPHTLNYTTSPEHGRLDVSGNVAFGERAVPELPASWTELAEAVREIRAGNDRAVEAALLKNEHAVQKAGIPGLADELPPLSASAQGSRDINRTVVLLLRSYTLNERVWRVQSAVVPDESGNFALQHVRPGTYWPVAINYATESGEDIGHFGFYDASGNFAPDPITVTDGNVTGIDLTLFDLEPVTASAYLELAEFRAQQEETGPELMEIASARVDENGKSGQWRYVFTNRENEIRLAVDVEPLSIRTVRANAPPGYASRARLPVSFIDSDEALSIAEAEGGSHFRSTHGDVVVSMGAGDMDLAVRPAPGSVFWHVRYTAQAIPADFSVFIDAETGEVLQAAPVSLDDVAVFPDGLMLARNFPNPFSAETLITISLPAPGPVRLVVYDLMGREVSRPADSWMEAGEHVLRVVGAGLSSGTYIYRIDAGGRFATHTMTLLR